MADIALVNPVRPLAKGVEARYFEMATLPTNGCIPTGDFIKPYNGGVRFINGDTLIARITPCLENGKAAYINILEDNEVALVQLNISFLHLRAICHQASIIF